MDLVLEAYLNYPPPPGVLVLNLAQPPVSLQARAETKHALKIELRSLFDQAKYYLSGEVDVKINWLLHPRKRYEGVHSPDIDNIIKPILDGLSGSEGIMINDCQVRAVSCYWIDILKEDYEEITVELSFSPDEWIKKDNLIWIEIQNHLCMPLNEELDICIKSSIVNHWIEMFRTRDQLTRLSGKWEIGQFLAPIQMPFHSSRLCGFRIKDAHIYLETLR